MEKRKAIRIGIMITAIIVALVTVTYVVSKFSLGLDERDMSFFGCIIGGLATMMGVVIGMAESARTRDISNIPMIGIDVLDPPKREIRDVYVFFRGRGFCTLPRKDLYFDISIKNVGTTDLSVDGIYIGKPVKGNNARVIWLPVTRYYLHSQGREAINETIEIGSTTIVPIRVSENEPDGKNDCLKPASEKDTRFFVEIWYHNRYSQNSRYKRRYEFRQKRSEDSTIEKSEWFSSIEYCTISTEERTNNDHKKHKDIAIKEFELLSKRDS